MLLLLYSNISRTSHTHTNRQWNINHLNKFVTLQKSLNLQGGKLILYVYYIIYIIWLYAYKLFNMNSKTSLPDSTLFTIEYELC